MNDDKGSKERRYRMIEILKSLGISMQVGGCGCCGSPWVAFSFNEEEIYQREFNGAFNTDEELKYDD